ncbi:MAG: DUF1588 domain-containing protein [Bdellovibrionales bacterium]|nr:DUF1588 domain-containing protein [Bdellovibrionales bacterium]
MNRLILVLLMLLGSVSCTYSSFRPKQFLETSESGILSDEAVETVNSIQSEEELELFIASGKNTYSNMCLNCHGPIESSAKKSATVIRIKYALANIPQMANLRLNEQQMVELELALSPEPINMPTPPPVVVGEMPEEENEGGSPGPPRNNPDPAPTPSPSPEPPDSSPQERALFARINVGGDQFIDDQGQTWAADSNFSNGRPWDYGEDVTIVGSPNQYLFRTKRFNPANEDRLSYDFNLTQGRYEVSLYFVELYQPVFRNGGRLFDIEIESQQVVTDLDVYREAGGAYRVLKRSFEVDVTDGQLNIEFIPGVDNPIVNALEIRSSVNALDTDNDGIANDMDNDDDGDGVPDTEDHFPLDKDRQYDGAQLYAMNCAGCHSSLDYSSKANRSASQIDTALATIPSMQGLSLNGIQTQAIAQALSASAECEDRPLLEPQIRRLTQAQSERTLTAVFGNIFSSSDFADLGDSYIKIGLNNDPNQLDINSIRLNRIYEATEGLVAKIISDFQPVRNCRNNGNANCVNNIYRDYGYALWRRPLTSQEMSQYSNRLGQANLRNNEDRLKFALSALLVSPNFWFRTEVGTVSGNRRRLTHYEVASLLSYTLWNSPPDNQLYTLASQSRLHDKQVIKQQISRMKADSKFAVGMGEFYVDFLKLENVITVDKAPRFTTSTRSALLSSARRSIVDAVTAADASYMEVFEGQQFYVNNQTASLFGLSNGSFGSQSRLTSFPANRREGILSHPAFLAVHSSASRSGIIHRGVFTLQQLLCENLGEPPDDLPEVEESDLPADFNEATATEREILHVKHSSQPACVSCHSKIDPAGYGFENFDLLGQFRLTEKQNVRIDSSGTLATGSSLNIQFQNSTDYIRKLVATDSMKTCVSSKFVKFALGQQPTNNSCEARNFQRNLNSRNNEIDALLEGLVDLPSFLDRQR